jgi:hypothetical protein
MVRLPHLIKTNIYIFSSKRPCPSAVTTPTLNLPCLTREIVRFFHLLYIVVQFWSPPPSSFVPPKVGKTISELAFAQAGRSNRTKMTADMVRLPTSFHKHKNISFVVNDLVHQLWLCIGTYFELALLYKGNGRIFSFAVVVHFVVLLLLLV